MGPISSTLALIEENFEIPTFTRFIGPNLTTDILKMHFLGNF
jgi:hypothetical protein